MPSLRHGGLLFGPTLFPQVGYPIVAELGTTAPGLCD